MEKETIILKPTYPHKIDPNKIQSVHDAIEILKGFLYTSMMKL